MTRSIRSLTMGAWAGVCAVIHRIFATIDVALEAFGVLAGGDDRPAGPRADRHAPLPPRSAVDQDEPLAARQEHAKAEASAVLVIAAAAFPNGGAT